MSDETDELRVKIAKLEFLNSLYLQGIAQLSDQIIQETAAHRAQLLRLHTEERKACAALVIAKIAVCADVAAAEHDAGRNATADEYLRAAACLRGVSGEILRRGES